MFVGGLNHITTADSLRKYFSSFGEVADSTVVKDAATGKSRGFGFVIFTSPEAVDAAQAARPHEVDGRTVETRRAVPRAEAAKQVPSASTTRRVFIGGLKTTTDEDTVLTYFSQYGQVEHVDLPEDKVSKRKRGFGYVAFTDTDPVDKVTIMKYHLIDGRKCEVKKAMTKSEMEKIHSLEKFGTEFGQGPKPGFADEFSAAGNMGMGSAGGPGGAGFMPGPNVAGGGGGMFPMNFDQQTLAAGYAAYMASLCAGNMGMGGNMGMMPGMPGMMPGMPGMNMMGNGMAGPNAGVSPSGRGAGTWVPPVDAKSGRPGKIRGGATFSSRSSGPYGGGYGMPGMKQQQPTSGSSQNAATGMAFSAYGHGQPMGEY
jgi:hypothetical protein